MGGHDLRKVQQTTIRDEMDHYMSNFDTSSHHKILTFSPFFLNGPWTWLNNVVCFSFDCWSVQLNGISLSFLVRCHFQQCWLPRWDPHTTGWNFEYEVDCKFEFLFIGFVHKKKQGIEQSRWIILGKRLQLWLVCAYCGSGDQTVGELIGTDHVATALGAEAILPLFRAFCKIKYILRRNLQIVDHWRTLMALL